jgi:opacity protein-like surface antigen
MTRAILVTTCAVACVAGTPFASAQGLDFEQFYLSVMGGIAFGPDDVSGRSSFPELNPNNVRKIDFDEDVALSVALGGAFMEMVRVEIEGAWRSQSAHRLTVQNEGSRSVGGDVDTFSLMANVWKDFEVAEHVSVHAGGGVGIAFIDLDINNIDFLAPPNVPFSDSATEFAYQVGAGGAYHFDNGMAVTLDYRLFGTTDPNFSGNGSRFNNYDEIIHTIFLGFRIPLGD